MRLVEIQIGSGTTATLHSSDEEPGTVHKRVRGRALFRNMAELQSDPYFQFINMIKQGNRLDNRFFPRIYNIETTQDARGLGYNVEMERLERFDMLTEEEARNIGNQLFHNFDAMRSFEDAKVRRKRGVPGATKEPAKAFLLEAIVDLLELSFSRQRIRIQPSSIKDPEFARAIALIRGLMKKQQLYSDMHEGNVMFRRTPHGPQLVIIDPV